MTTLALSAFGSLEVCQMTGLTYRRLDYLVAEGFVRSTRDARPGQGNPRTFRFVDVEVAAVLGRLSELGMDRRTWACVSERLYVLPRPWPDSWLVCWPDRPAIVVEHLAALDRMPSLDLAAVVHLPPVLKLAP